MTDWTTSLAGSISGVADDVRELASELGARAHTAHLVWQRWSGDSRGDGSPQIEREVELTPTPKISLAGSTRYRRGPGGSVREGDAFLGEVSLRYSPDLLRGEDLYRGRLPANVEFFYELRPVPGSGGAVLRMSLAGEPVRDHERVEYRIDLQHRNPDTPMDGRTAASVVY